MFYNFHRECQLWTAEQETLRVFKEKSGDSALTIS